MSKNLTRRVLSLFLSLAVIFTFVCVPAFAEGEVTETTDTEESVTDETGYTEEELKDAEAVEDSSEESTEIVEESAEIVEDSTDEDSTDTVEEQGESLTVGAVRSVMSVSSDDETEVVSDLTAISEEVTVVAASNETEDSEDTDEPGESSGTDTDTSTGVAQIGDTKYETLQAAIDAAEDDVVTLIANVTDEAIGIGATQAITLDLAGYTLKAESSIESGRLITIRGGSLTITDSSDTGEGGSGTITSSVGDSVIYVAGGTVTVESGTIAAMGSMPAIINNWQSGNYADAPSAIVVNGGKVTAAGAAALRNNAAGCSITVNGGEIVGYSESTGYYIVDSMSEENSGAVVITGGYFTTDDDSAIQVLFYQANSGNIVISGGYFNNAISWINSAMRVTGYVNVDLGEDNAKTYNGTSYQYTVGFSDEVAALYGYIKNGTPVYSGSASNPTQAVNAITTLALKNLDADAFYIELAEDATTVFDIGINTIIDTERNLTSLTVVLELNGYDITTGTTAAAIVVESGVTLTVRDSKGTSAVSSSYASGTVRNRGGVLTIEGGIYTNTAESGCIIQNNGSSSEEDGAYTTTITGGYFGSGTLASITYGSLSIEGGYYTDDLSNSEYLASGYVVAEKSDDTYPYYVTETVFVGQDIDVASGEIAVNVYINGSVKNVSVSVTTDDVTTSSAVEAATNNNTSNNGIVSDYVLTQNVVAKKMADEWTVIVTLENGYAAEYETSVQECAESIINNTTTTQNKKDALIAMLNYGAAVQSCDGYGTVLANANYEYTSNDLSGVTVDSMIAADVKRQSYSNGNYSGTYNVSLSSVGMVFGYDFEIDLTYANCDTVYVTYITLGDDDNNKKTLVKDTDYTVDGATIKITGLTAADLNEALEIMLNDGNTTPTDVYATKISALYYARLLADSTLSGTSDNNVFLGQTLYKYATSVSKLN